MNTSLVRRRVETICRRFPSEVAVFSRPVLDAYNQPTAESTPLGSVECWRIPGARPDQWAVAQAGQVYGDEDAIWISVVWRADLPKWKHGDVCLLPDGVRRTVRNIQTRGDIRVFLQLAEV